MAAHAHESDGASQRGFNRGLALHRENSMCSFRWRGWETVDTVAEGIV